MSEVVEVLSEWRARANDSHRMLIKSREHVGRLLLNLHVFPNTHLHHHPRALALNCRPPTFARTLKLAVATAEPVVSYRTPPTTTMTMADSKRAFSPREVASDVQALAESDAPIAPLVREALEVIDRALDTHGWVRSCRGLSCC